RGAAVGRAACVARGGVPAAGGSTVGGRGRDLRRARPRARPPASARVGALPRAARGGARARARGVIRIAEEADWGQVLEVHRLAFGEEDVPRLVTELREARLDVPSLSFVAVSAGRVGGNCRKTRDGL